MSGPPLVVLTGDLDLAVAADVQARLLEGAEAAVALGQPLCVDMSAVTFIDSTGMSCLIAAMAVLHAHADDLRLRLVGVARNVHRVLTLGGLTDLCDVEPAPEDQPGGAPDGS